MTTLAPRRKKIFVKRGRFLPALRLVGLTLAFIGVAGIAFAAGVKLGADTNEVSAIGAVVAAYAD